jgi:hypothetical protein
VGTETPSLRVQPGFAELFVILGGGVAVIGSFLEWFRVDIGARPLGLIAQTVTSKGFDGSDGKITLMASAVTVLLGVLMFLRTAGGRRVALGVAALLGGLSTAALSGYDAATPQQRFIDANAPELARRAHISLAMAERLYRGLFNSGAVKISSAAGIFVVIAGGSVAALAAMFALGKSPRVPLPVAAQPGPVPPEPRP